MKRLCILAYRPSIIQTHTGLADPAPVAQTFFVDEEVREFYYLDAIVTMVKGEEDNVRCKS